MNQFRLDKDHTLAAHYQCDKHIVKMPTEVAQQHCDNLRVFGYTKADFPWLDEANAPNHPVTKWVRESYANWLDSLAHGFALVREYQFRYGDKKGKTHKAFEKLLCIRSIDVTGHFDNFFPTHFPLCMPPECKVGGLVESYRRYYAQEKWHILAYRNGRKIPPWLIEEMKQC